jgi:hypothetical protein
VVNVINGLWAYQFLLQCNKNCWHSRRTDEARVLDYYNGSVGSSLFLDFSETLAWFAKQFPKTVTQRGEDDLTLSTICPANAILLT